MQNLERIKNQALPFLILAFIAHRMTFLLLAHPFYSFVYPSEELYRGAMAYELIEGLRLPFFDYRPDNYAGGSYIIALLALPFFLFLGANAFALKLVPVFLFAVALGFWFKSIERGINRTTALLFAVFFIFSPSVFTRFSVVPMGDHYETILLSGIVLFLLLRMAQNPARKLFYTALLGATLGFGLWFAYIMAITAAAVLLFLFITDRSFYNLKSLAVFGAGFLTGFSLWIAANLLNGFQGLSVHHEPLWNSFSPETWMKRIANPKLSAVYGIASYFQIYEEGRLAEIKLSILFYRLLFIFPAATALLLFFINRRKKKSEKVNNLPPVVLFSVIYLLTFICINQISHYYFIRYYFPTLPFIFLLSSWAWNRFFYRRKIIILTVAVAAVMGHGYFHQHIFSLKTAGALIRTPGYDYSTFLISPVCTANIGRCVEIGLQFAKRIENSNDHHQFLSQLAGSFWDLQFSGQAAESADKVKTVSDPIFRRHLFFYWGIHLQERFDARPEEALRNLRTLEEDPEAFHLALAGYSQASSMAEPESPHEMLSRAASIPPPVLSYFWRSHGSRWTYKLARQIPPLDDFAVKLSNIADQLPEIPRNFFWEGAGTHLYDRWTQYPFNPLWQPQNFENFPFELRAHLLRGAGFAAGGTHSFNAAIPLTFKSGLSLENQAIFEGAVNESTMSLLSLREAGSLTS